MAPSILLTGSTGTNPLSLDCPVGTTLLVVITNRTHVSNASVPSSMTYNGVALGQATSADVGAAATAIWTLKNPTPGVHDLAWVGGTGDNTTPYWFLGEAEGVERDTLNTTAGSASQITGSLDSEVDDLCIFGCACTDSNAFSPLLGMTETLDADGSPGRHGAGTEAGAQGSQDAGFDGGNGNYAMVGISIPPELLGGARFFGL